MGDICAVCTALAIKTLSACESAFSNKRQKNFSSGSFCLLPIPVGLLVLLFTRQCRWSPLFFSCTRDRRALQQLALNVHVKHSDLTWPSSRRTLERFQGIRTLSTERTIIVQAGLWSVFTFTALFYITFYEIVMSIYYYFSTVLKILKNVIVTIKQVTASYKLELIEGNDSSTRSQNDNIRVSHLRNII